MWGSGNILKEETHMSTLFSVMFKKHSSKFNRNTMQSWFYQSHLFEVLLCASLWAIVSQSYVGRMGGPQGQSVKVQKIFLPMGFDPWTIQKKNMVHKKIFWRCLDLPKIYAEDWIWKNPLKLCSCGFHTRERKRPYCTTSVPTKGTWFSETTSTWEMGFYC